MKNNKLIYIKPGNHRITSYILIAMSLLSFSNAFISFGKKECPADIDSRVGWMIDLVCDNFGNLGLSIIFIVSGVFFLTIGIPLWKHSSNKRLWRQPLNKD